VDEKVDATGQSCVYVEYFGQFRWEQRIDIFDSNLAVSYNMIVCRTLKISQQRCTADAIDVIFYDVIRLQSVRRDSKVPTEGHFLPVYGKFDP